MRSRWSTTTSPTACRQSLPIPNPSPDPNPNPNPSPDPNDNPHANVSSCVQCAGALEKVVLFGAYGWNAQPPAGGTWRAALPRNVVRCFDWREAAAELHRLLDRLEANQAMLLG